MLKIILWLVSFMFFTCIGMLVFNRLYKNKLLIYHRVSQLITQKTAETGDGDDLVNKTIYERFVLPFVTKIRKSVRDITPKQKTAQIEKRLQAAGHPFGLSAADFLLIQHVLPAALFLLLVFAFVPASDEKAKVILLALIGAGFIYFYLNYYLTAKSKQRVHEIERAMPDFFDMLNVSIEAGLGLDGALKKVCNQIKSPLSSEFLSALEDMKLGKSRRQAFLEITYRVPSEFLSSVLHSIIQADQMGMGMSKVLRAQTTRIREKHRFTAKEKAMKAPVKMLIPMVLFIFPTLFVVLLGPVVINLITTYLL